jgi:hypothetical protein
MATAFRGTKREEEVAAIPVGMTQLGRLREDPVARHAGDRGKNAMRARFVAR